MLYFGENAQQNPTKLIISKSDLGITGDATAQQIFTAIIEQARRYSQGIIENNNKPLIISDNDPLEYDNSRGKKIAINYTRNDVIDNYKIAIIKLIIKIPGEQLTPLDINEL